MPTRTVGQNAFRLLSARNPPMSLEATVEVFIQASFAIQQRVLRQKK